MKLLLALLLCTVPSFAYVRAVVFDLDQVVATISEQPIDDYLGAHRDTTLEEVREAAGRCVEQLVIQGRIDEKIFWQQHLAPLSPDFFFHLREAHTKSVTRNTDIETIASGLRQRGYTVCMLTNLMQSQVQALSRTDLFDLFEHTFFSCQIGLAKPHPDCYLHMLRRLTLPPDEVVVIDTDSDHLEAAAALGMHTILYTTPDQLLTDLADLDIYPR